MSLRDQTQVDNDERFFMEIYNEHVLFTELVQPRRRDVGRAERSWKIVPKDERCFIAATSVLR
jgi:hypothetical protein